MLNITYNYKKTSNTENIIELQSLLFLLFMDLFLFLSVMIGC